MDRQHVAYPKSRDVRKYIRRCGQRKEKKYDRKHLVFRSCYTYTLIACLSFLPSVPFCLTQHALLDTAAASLERSRRPAGWADGGTDANDSASCCCHRRPVARLCRRCPTRAGRFHRPGLPPIAPPPGTAAPRHRYIRSASILLSLSLNTNRADGRGAQRRQLPHHLPTRSPRPPRPLLLGHQRRRCDAQDALQCPVPEGGLLLQRGRCQVVEGDGRLEADVAPHRKLLVVCLCMSTQANGE